MKLKCRRNANFALMKFVLNFMSIFSLTSHEIHLCRIKFQFDRRRCRERELIPSFFFFVVLVLIERENCEFWRAKTAC